MNPMGPQYPPYPPYQQPPGGMPPGGMPPYAPPSYEYEFDDAQNRIISGAALWARILGIALIVVGVFGLFNCSILQFVENLVCGIFLIGAGGSMAMVVNTQGNDITHMMQAMSKLGTAFKVRVIMTIIFLVLTLLVIGFAMLFFVAAAAGSR